MTDSVVVHPFGRLDCRRWPLQRLSGRHQQLRAWDNADLYLLNNLAEQGAGATTLVVNDQFGLLTLATQQRDHAISLNDSFIARQAAQYNAELNQIAWTDNGWFWCDTPLDPHAGQQVHQVLMRMPKDLSLFTLQLQQLHAALPAGTPVYIAGMDKHLPRQLVPILQQQWGNGEAGLGWKKARIFRAHIPATDPPDDPLNALTVDVKAEPLGRSIAHFPGVFSRQHLDIGARCFIEHLPQRIDAGSVVVDLGCGNGVIGLALLQHQPDCTLWFADESRLALANARHNAAALFPTHGCHFFHGDGLSDWPGAADLVLLNPPFHQGHVVGEDVAKRLFNQAHERLREGGELRLVANRHLRYWPYLAKRFATVTQVGETAKFIVLSCIK